MIDRYSRNPVELQQWMDIALGNPPRSISPADTLLMDVLALALRFHELRTAYDVAKEARLALDGSYSRQMTTDEFAAWIVALKTADKACYEADEAAWAAYVALERAIIGGMQDVRRVYRGIVEGFDVRVTYEPVRNLVTVDVAEVGQ